MSDTLVVPLTGGEEFVCRTVAETGCSRSLAQRSLDLILRRHRPQPGHLHRYLSRLTPADRARWLEQAIAEERAALASILVGELAAGFDLARALPTAEAEQAEADRRRRSFVRAYPEAADFDSDLGVRKRSGAVGVTTRSGRLRGLDLLDAALAEMRSAVGVASGGGVSCGQTCGQS